jgi:hypothetical protein
MIENLIPFNSPMPWHSYQLNPVMFSLFHYGLEAEGLLGENHKCFKKFANFWKF